MIQVLFSSVCVPLLQGNHQIWEKWDHKKITPFKISHKESRKESHYKSAPHWFPTKKQVKAANKIGRGSLLPASSRVK